MLNESKNSKFCRIIWMDTYIYIDICVVLYLTQQLEKRGCRALAADATGFAKTCLRPWRFEVPQPSAWGVHRRASCWAEFLLKPTLVCEASGLEKCMLVGWFLWWKTVRLRGCWVVYSGRVLDAIKILQADTCQHICRLCTKDDKCKGCLKRFRQ